MPEVPYRAPMRALLPVFNVYVTSFIIPPPLFFVSPNRLPMFRPLTHSHSDRLPGMDSVAQGLVV